MNKNITLMFSLLVFCSCNSLQNKIIGIWRVTGEIQSDNTYATRSSLKETKIISEKKNYNKQG